LERTELYSTVSEERLSEKGFSNSAKVYLEKIDPLVRSTVQSLHTGVDFVIVAYLMEKNEATFTQIGKDLDLDKNSLAYSLRKMVTSGTIVNHYERTGIPPRERSIYELSEFTKELLKSASKLLQGISVENFLIQEKIDAVCEKFPVLSEDAGTVILYERILTETINSLQQNLPFASQMSRISILPRGEILHAVATDNIAWKHFITSLNLSISKFSTEIRMKGAEYDVSNDFMKLIVFSQIVGYVILCNILAKFQESMKKMWEETRTIRLNKAELLLAELEKEGFDSLKGFTLLHTRQKHVGQEKQGR